MIVYKVVLKRTSYVSSFCTQYGVRYDPNKVSTPRVGFLYAFRTREDAIEYVNTHLRSTYLRSGNIVILECNAVVTRHRIHRVCMSSSDRFPEFWEMKKLYRDSDYSRIAPKGTVYCREITPIREVV